MLSNQRSPPTDQTCAHAIYIRVHSRSTQYDYYYGLFTGTYSYVMSMRVVGVGVALPIGNVALP
jgi:hypothetical protein